MANFLQKITAKFKSKQGCTHSAALMMTNASLYLLVYKNGHKLPIHSAQVEKTENTSWQNCIKNILNHPSLKQAKLNIVIPSEQYHLAIVDKPEVDEDEIIQALKYSAKDYITSHMDDIAIEYFDIPIQIFGQNKINLIAAKKHFLQDLINICLKQCKQLNRITIDELAFQDIFIDDSDASMLVVHQPKEEVLMQIVKDGKLFFFRRLRGFLNLDKFAEFEITNGASDSLSLEIQRSLDYFESQLRQAPVKRIYISVTNPFESVLIDKIGENFTIPVLPLKNRVADELPEHLTDHGFYPTIGAAQELLRQI